MRTVVSWVLLSLITCIGCAQAVVRKVPNRSDYEVWTDAKQREADEMCGLRFYRSRPYVVVHQPFPVAAKSYLVDAMVSNDGETIRIVGDCKNPLADKLIHVGVASDFKIPLDMVWKAGTVAAVGRALGQSGGGGGPVGQSGGAQAAACKGVNRMGTAFTGSAGTEAFKIATHVAFITGESSRAFARLKSAFGEKETPILHYDLEDFNGDLAVWVEVASCKVKGPPTDSSSLSGNREFTGSDGSPKFTKGNTIVGSESKARATLRHVGGADGQTPTLTYELLDFTKYDVSTGMPPVRLESDKTKTLELPKDPSVGANGIRTIEVTMGSDTLAASFPERGIIVDPGTGARGTLKTVKADGAKLTITYSLIDFKEGETVRGAELAWRQLEAEPDPDTPDQFVVTVTPDKPKLNVGSLLTGQFSHAHAKVTAVDYDTKPEEPKITYRLVDFNKGERVTARIFDGEGTALILASSEGACTAGAPRLVCITEFEATNVSGTFEEKEVIRDDTSKAIGVLAEAVDPSTPTVKYFPISEVAFKKDDVVTGAKNNATMVVGETPKTRTFAPLGSGQVAPPGAEPLTINPAAGINPETADRTAADSPTGVGSVSLSTARGAITQKKVTDNFDIIYLPDFEEEFVVDPKENLGSLDVRFTQGPGGVLMAMGMEVDNSAITRPIVDALGKVWGAVGDAGASAVSRVVPPRVPTGQSGGGGAITANEVFGAIKTLRIHVISMANPGMYPILKADEMVDNRTCLSRLKECGCPACQGVSARQLAAEQHVVPVYPFSRIAYQVHQNIIVEELTPQRQQPYSLRWKPEPRRSPTGQSGGGGGVPTGQSGGGGAGVATLTNQNLLRQINHALSSKCSCTAARILIRDPGVGDLQSIRTLKLLITHKSGRPTHSVMLPTVEHILRDKFPWHADMKLELVTKE